MDGNSKFIVVIFACLAALGVVLYALLAPTWDDGKTTALVAGVIGCPTVLGMIGAVFLGLHWRDERQAARANKDLAQRQQGINRQTQNAQAFSADAFVMRQTLDLLGQVAQVQARQAGAGLAELRRDVFAQRSIEEPAQEIEPAWFSGEWSYDDEATADVETSGGVRYL